MNNLKISSITIALLLILLFMHVYGMYAHLYTIFWFYDIIVHILGGVCVALSLYCFGLFFNISALKKIWVITVLTFAAGLAWEVFEVYYDIAGHPFGTGAYIFDTIKDLIDDTLGALAASWIILRKK